VCYNLLVFKPYIHEIIEGTVGFQDRTGIRISLKFFETVFIPAQFIPDGYIFDSDEQMWSKSDDEFIEDDEIILFKVIKIRFKKYGITPKQTNNSSNNNNNSSNNNNNNIPDSSSDDDDIYTQKHYSQGTLGNKLSSTKMLIIGTINEIGLGPRGWW